MADILVFCMRQETGDTDSFEASPWNWVVMNVLLPSQLQYTESWNNGKEVPRWGVAEIQKMNPSTTVADIQLPCYKQGSGDSRPMGVQHGNTAANHTDLL